MRTNRVWTNRFKIILFLNLISSLACAERAGQDLNKSFPLSEYSAPTSVPYSERNPYSLEKAELGRVLFFDPRLSLSRTQSCVSCHHPGLGWEMGIPKAIGAGVMARKAQTLLNVAWSDTLFWDGRGETFADQFHTAMTSPKAMAMSSEEMLLRLRAIKGYESLFKKAFPDAAISEVHVTDAIEIFERGLVAKNAPFDAWIKGDTSALSTEAKRGAQLFAGKAGCINCHSGWNFSDNGFHDIGLQDADLGRGARVKLPSMQHAFKTPTLRDVAQRAPYMHDGSLVTLEDVVEHYDQGARDVKRPSLAPEMKPLHLSRREKSDLIQFLKSLTGPVLPISVPELPM